MNEPEPIDLGNIAVHVDLQISPSEVWMGPADSDTLAMFGPGTTRGGRAEAGWFEIGTIGRRRAHIHTGHRPGIAPDYQG